MEPRLCLVVIRVTDLARARRFYESLGLTFREEQHGSGPAHLACELGDSVVEIYPAKSAEDLTTRTRLGFRVTDLDALAEAAARANGSMATPPLASPWGRRAVLRDPDGHFVELVETVSRVTPSP
jgi:predicted enzyme related to lactoylglutathione lyase